MTKSKMKINKYIIVALLIAFLFAMQYLFSLFGWMIAGLFDYSAIDKDGLFAEVAVHHIVQMICSIAIIILLYKIKGIRGFKLRPKYDIKGIRYIIIFCTVLLAYYMVTGAFVHSINSYDYELNPTNVIGTLGFQLFLTGPSEEILCRSLPITLLLNYMKPVGKKERAIAVVIAAFLFGLGHISVFTFSIPWSQVCSAFVFGLVFGFTLIRTESIIYPIIMHSLSNVISVGGCYLYMLSVK